MTGGIINNGGSNSSSSPYLRHIAVCTWPFSSHPVAFFNIIRKLATAVPQIQFSFFSTAKINNYIFYRTQSSSSDIPTNIKTYNVDDGLPGAVDRSTVDHAEEVSCFIKRVPDNFKHSFDVALAETDGDRKFNFLITDCLVSFEVSKMAYDMNIPWMALWSPAPQDLAVYFQMDFLQQLYASRCDQEKDQDVIDVIPGLPAVCFNDLPFDIVLKDHERDTNPVLPLISSMIRKLPEASAVVINSFEEINSPDLTSYLKSKFQNLFFVSCSTLSGTLPASYSTTDATAWLPWLDTQNDASVAYISFGTVVDIPCQELVALAEALEESGVPFLWSLQDKFKNCLPNWFLEKIGKRGIIVPWVPQIKVLEHPSIDVFVTHCGYNSVLESISRGAPMICRPVWGDNHMTAKMVEEVWKIGVRVEGRVITKEGMLKSLEVIFKHEKGKDIGQAINGLKEVLLKAARAAGVAATHIKCLEEIVKSLTLTKH